MHGMGAKRFATAKQPGQNQEEAESGWDKSCHAYAIRRCVTDYSQQHEQATEEKGDSGHRVGPLALSQ